MEEGADDNDDDDDDDEEEVLLNFVNFLTVTLFESLDEEGFLTSLLF